MTPIMIFINNLQMNSKTPFKIVISFIILVSVIFSFAIHVSLENYKKRLEEVRITDQITRKVFEKKLLADEYLQQTILLFSVAVTLLLLLLLGALWELLRNAKKLEQRKAKDEAILESIGEGILGTDKEGKIIVMNR